MLLVSISRVLQAFAPSLKSSNSTSAQNPQSRSDYVYVTGWLKKQGGTIRSWKNRYMILKGSTLYYFKAREVSESNNSLLSIIYHLSSIILYVFLFYCIIVIITNFSHFPSSSLTFLRMASSKEIMLLKLLERSLCQLTLFMRLKLRQVICLDSKRCTQLKEHTTLLLRMVLNW